MTENPYALFIDKDRPLRAEQFIVAGRGYGKNAAAAHYRKLDAAMRELYPPVPPAEVIGNLSVRWSCPKPTAPPPYPIGSNGWMQEQAGLVLAGKKTIAAVVAEAEAVR